MARRVHLDPHAIMSILFPSTEIRMRHDDFPKTKNILRILFANSEQTHTDFATYNELDNILTIDSNHVENTDQWVKNMVRIVCQIVNTTSNHSCALQLSSEPLRILSDQIVKEYKVYDGVCKDFILYV